MSELIMSLSGTRGIVGDNLHPQLGVDMGMAVGTLIGKGPVIVGGDTRVSHELLKGPIISGLISVGTDVIDIGKVPTPTVQQLILHYKAAAGMVITASHNPIMWNGVKLMNNTGSFFSTEEYDQFMSLYSARDFQLVTWDKLGKVTKDETALEIHINKILSLVNTDSIKNANLKVLIDANQGTGALANPLLLDKLGVNYDIINGDPSGLFSHNPEPVKQNLSEIISILSNGDYDIGFVQDADADRLVILDENGHFIGEDYSLAYCIDYILGLKEQNNPKVVVNLSTSLVIEDIATRHGASVMYTKIGEANVTQGLKDTGAVVGGEGNGGVIYPKVGWGRDSLVGIIIALKHLAESKKTVSQTISTYPKFSMLRDKFEVTSREAVSGYLTKISSHFSDYPQDKQDGVKVMINDGWIHVRPSNTEPIVRIFIEGSTTDQVNALHKEVLSLA